MFDTLGLQLGRLSRLRVVGVPVRIIGALLFIVAAYWLGLLAVARLSAGYGALVLLLVPVIGLVVLLMALPVPAELSKSQARSLALWERSRYKSAK